MLGLLSKRSNTARFATLPQDGSNASHVPCKIFYEGTKKSQIVQERFARSRQRWLRPCLAATAASSGQPSSSGQREQISTQAVERRIGHAVLGIMAAICRFLRQATPPELQGSRSAVQGALRTLRMATVVVPFASAGMGGTAFLVTRAIASFLQTYLLLLFLRVLLSWFPTFNWERQPWLTLRQMTDPYLQLFRGLIPPLLGMIDFTPLLGFFVLQWISGELQSITMEGDIEEFW